MPRGFPVFQLFIAALSSGGLIASVDFNRDIRPILSDHCFACHGPDEHERKGKLRLDTSEGAHRGGETGSTIVPGNPGESELIHRIFSSDPDEVMPPPGAHKELSNDQKALLRHGLPREESMPNPGPTFLRRSTPFQQLNHLAGAKTGSTTSFRTDSVARASNPLLMRTRSLWCDVSTLISSVYLQLPRRFPSS